MSQHINTYFTQTLISFEDKPIDNSMVPLPFQEEANFGILKLDAVSSEITTQEQEFIFVVDRSGSMSSFCSDNKTKLDHIIHTLKNMILYFNANPSINLHITIFVFHDYFETLIERTRITQQNLIHLIAKIENIKSDFLTNIENALQNVGQYISTLKQEHPSHNINHIFMTDGEATVGSKDIDVLKNLIDTTIYNAFIGFGTQHDNELLVNLSNHKNSSYHFIDAIEKSGLVYGEIIHEIIYKHLTNVNISVHNCLIYNYKTNTWQTDLYVGNIVSEASKIFHLASTCPLDTKVTVHFDKDANHVFLELNNNFALHCDELSKYIYRQRTLQLLFISNQVQSIEKSMHNTFGFFDKDIDYNVEMFNLRQKQSDIKYKLLSLFEEMKKIIDDYPDSKDNKFIKNLCDDIYVAYCTFGTKHGTMYSSARQISQGTQRSYSAGVTHEIEDFTYDMCGNNLYFLDLPTKLSRQSTISSSSPFGLLFNNDDLVSPLVPLLNYNLSDFTDNPYNIPSATQVMRFISGTLDENDLTQPSFNCV
jgi:hypothetical protein